jgi:hypothetical protein
VGHALRFEVERLDLQPFIRIRHAAIIRASLLHSAPSGESFPVKPPKAQSAIKIARRTLRQKD